MEVGELQQSLMDYMNSLRSQEILDSQFGQLQRLQDESSPNFVAEVLTLFFTDSKDLIKELSEALYKIPNQQNVDFKEVDSCVHQLKGSSARGGLDFGLQMPEVPGTNARGVQSGEEQTQWPSPGVCLIGNLLRIFPNSSSSTFSSSVYIQVGTLSYGPDGIQS
ncbi:hypothetical protein CDL15_Pgr008477 [Punica granatum]|uniref:Histidine-containing phosphotransfer protein n=1 Tax=Punica granatum TaxID=22663 RepID=A0A218WNE5_PUNGR|nr:hypothetical protein CDL15_Pgr008477 [Punica granatum]